MEKRRHSMELAGRTLVLETGTMARQSAGAVTVSYGETVVLVAVNAASEPREGVDFFPLSVEHRERAYAGGKIPGGFFKREGRPSEKEILASRLTDRPIRPLFPDEFRCETQVMINLLSTDQENPADILGSIGASTALMISDIPWNGPIGSVRVGYIDGKPIINPTYSQLESSKLDLIVTGNEESIVMMEGESKEITEDELITAIQYAHEAIKDIVNFQKEFIDGIPVKKRELEIIESDEELINEIEKKINGQIQQFISIHDKNERRSKINDFIEQIISDLGEKFPDQEVAIKNIIDNKIKKSIREMIISKGARIDGRDVSEIREIDIQLSVLPRTHGSALFTRGETQSLTTVTLGSKTDEQFIDDIDGEYQKKYMLHYNFPPFSVGEVRRFLGVSRREVGHGNLAERALKYVMPSFEEFPYTIRVVSDILESNGSSSMATVCAGSLALMDSGVPIKDAVAGISIGLVADENKTVLLTDIIGDEDHYGDMDFKVAGTKKGITSIQLDLKISGIPLNLISEALERAKEGRLYILDIMNQHISKPRESVSKYAPKILRLKINPEKIGELIGPGGRNIRSISSESGCQIDIEDDGTVMVSSLSKENCEKGKNLIEAITMDFEEGMVFDGIVRRITNFGAFVEIAPGREGLLHISQIDHKHVKNVGDVIKIGDKITVKIINVDEFGRIDLSRKALIERPADMRYRPPHSEKRYARKNNKFNRKNNRSRYNRK